MLLQFLLLSSLSNPSTIAPPPPALDDFGDRLAYAELLGTPDEIQIVGYSSAGEPIATIAIWIDDRGAHHLEADYQDGYSSTIVIDGRDVTTSTLSGDILTTRANLFAERLALPGSGPQESRWYSCGLSVAASAAACAGSGALPILIVGCGAGIWTSACKCLQAAHPDDPAVWEGPCENV